ncbi:5-formyltetrahydrofolate cyclo-ligase [Clostridium sp.]
METSLKDNLRKDMLLQRKSMHMENVSAFSNKIVETIIELPEFISSKSIMLYLSFKSEVNTYDLAKWCLDNGKKIIVPYCIKETKEIIPFEIHNLTTDLAKSSFGIMEPKYDLLKPFNIEDIDFIIVPGVVFDEHCNRIGFGAGYYDRFLPKKLKTTPTIGIAYDYQVVSKIPTGIYDVPLDFIITEKRIIRPK